MNTGLETLSIRPDPPLQENLIGSVGLFGDFIRCFVVYPSVLYVQVSVYLIDNLFIFLLLLVILLLISLVALKCLTLSRTVSGLVQFSSVQPARERESARAVRDGWRGWGHGRVGGGGVRGG